MQSLLSKLRTRFFSKNKRNSKKDVDSQAHRVELVVETSGCLRVKTMVNPENQKWGIKNDVNLRDRLRKDPGLRSEIPDLDNLIISQNEIIRRMTKRILSLTKVEDITLPQMRFRGRISMSLHEYVDRLVRYSNSLARDLPGPNSFGISCAIMAWELIERIFPKVNHQSIEKLFGIAFVLCLKINEDDPMSTTFLGKLVGFSASELTRNEIRFISALDWKLLITCDEFNSRKNSIVNDPLVLELV